MNCMLSIDFFELHNNYINKFQQLHIFVKLLVHQVVELSLINKDLVLYEKLIFDQYLNYKLLFL